VGRVILASHRFCRSGQVCPQPQRSDVVLRAAVFQALAQQLPFFYNTVAAMAVAIEINRDRIVFGFQPCHRLLCGQFNLNRRRVAEIVRQAVGHSIPILPGALVG
jgi:hypothetical protein